MANQQLQMEIIAKDLATATLQKVDAALLDVANRQGSVTAATNRATTASGEFRAGLSKVQGTLVNLSGDLLGVNNKVGNLIEGLLGMALGGGAVVAVVGGLGAIGYAVRQRAKEMDELAKAATAVRDRMAEAFGSRFAGSETELRRQLAAEQQRFARLNATATGQGLNDALRVEITKTAAAIQELTYRLEQLNRPTAGSRAGATGTALDAILPKTGDIGGKLFGGPKGPEAPLALRLGGEFTAAIPQIEEAGTVFTDFADTLDLIVFRMGAISDATMGLAEGFAALGQVVGGGIGQVAQKILAPFMKLEGTYFVIKGLAKLAEGLFPPNPALIASGSGMVARGRQLLAMAGGGGTGGGTGAGGGSAGSSASRDVRDTAQQRGTVTVVWPKDAFANPRDPKFQEYLAETIRAAAGRNVVFA